MRITIKVNVAMPLADVHLMSETAASLKRRWPNCGGTQSRGQLHWHLRCGTLTGSLMTYYLEPFKDCEYQMKV